MPRRLRSTAAASAPRGTARTRPALWCSRPGPWGPAGTWGLVDAVWDGAAPKLYVNGVDTLAAVSGPGGYNASTSAIFSVGSYDTGSNPFTGGVDETAFYDKALNAAQILAHFNAASIPNASAYSTAVLADAPIEYLRNDVPEPSVAFLAVFGVVGCGGLRRRVRRGL